MHRFLLALLLFTASAGADDLSGIWSGTGVSKNEKQSFYFIFRTDGATLNGSGGPDLFKQDVIQNGRIDGEKVSFDLSPGANTMLHFELSADGAGLKGAVELKNGHETVSGTVVLKKVKT